MKNIDAVIDSEPTEKRIIDLVEYRNRNLLAFKELKTFNDKGKWLNKHPLLSQYSIRFKFEKLLKEKPDKFLDEYARINSYVSRYKSYLKNDKRSETQKEKDVKNLKKHEEREQLIKEILDERNNSI